MDNKVKEELIVLKHDKEEYTEKLRQAKVEVIKIIERAEEMDIIELESKYCSFTDMKRYAQKLNDINVKLRTINYIIGNE
jgi:hypothetical protein